jgi:hypothetical protein
MNSLHKDRAAEHGSAGIKVLLIFLGLFLLGHALWNYVPIAYNGASFKQEMDTAVVKALAASGQIKPLEVASATVTKAARDYQLPPDAILEVKPVGAAGRGDDVETFGGQPAGGGGADPAAGAGDDRDRVHRAIVARGLVRDRWRAAA